MWKFLYSASRTAPQLLQRRRQDRSPSSSTGPALGASQYVTCLTTRLYIILGGSLLSCPEHWLVHPAVHSSRVPAVPTSEDIRVRVTHATTLLPPNSPYIDWLPRSNSFLISGDLRTTTRRGGTHLASDTRVSHLPCHLCTCGYQLK